MPKIYLVPYKAIITSRICSKQFLGFPTYGPKFKNYKIHVEEQKKVYVRATHGFKGQLK